MAIELLKPSRSNYTSDDEWLYACGVEAERYTRSMVRAIDRGCSYPSVDSRRVREYDDQRKYGHVKTLVDQLADNPALVARYKKYGPSVLFEI